SLRPSTKLAGVADPTIGRISAMATSQIVNRGTMRKPSVAGPAVCCACSIYRLCRRLTVLGSRTARHQVDVLLMFQIHRRFLPLSLSPRYQQFGLAGRHKFDGNGSRIPQFAITDIDPANR